MTPGNLTLQISRGLSLVIEAELCSDDFGDVPVDLTGCSVQAAIRPVPDDLSRVELDCTITDAEAGLVLVELDAAMTALLGAGAFSWDLNVTDSAGIPNPTLTGRVEISDNALA